MASTTHKPGLPTMLHRRSGGINPTTARAMCGPSGASSMKWRLWSRPSRRMIWTPCLKECSWASTKGYPNASPRISLKWSGVSSKWILISDPPWRKYLPCQVSNHGLKSFSRKKLHSITLQYPRTLCNPISKGMTSNFSKPLETRRILSSLRSSFLPQTLSSHLKLWHLKSRRPNNRRLKERRLICNMLLRSKINPWLIPKPAPRATSTNPGRGALHSLLFPYWRETRAAKHLIITISHRQSKVRADGRYRYYHSYHERAKIITNSLI